MDPVHHLSELLSPWVGAHPVITIISAFAIGFVAAKLIFGRKKKEK